MKMCKLLFPLVPEKNRAFVAVFIKYQELMYTISFFQKCYLRFPKENLSFPEQLSSIAKEILPYCPESYQPMIRQFMNLFEQLQHMKDLEPILRMFDQADQSANPFLQAMLRKEDQDLVKEYEKLFD